MSKGTPTAFDLEQLFELSLDLFCVASFDGYFLVLNPSWERVLGYSRGELLGRPFIDFVHPDDRERTMAEAGRLGAGGEPSLFENRYRARDGSYRWFLWRSTPSVEHQRIYAVAHDVTDMKQAHQKELARSQDMLVRMERLRALGEMVAGVSHDLKNVLVNPLGLHLELASRALQRGNGERAQEVLATMRDIIRQGTDTIDRLRNFSRQSSGSHIGEIATNELARRAFDIASTRMVSQAAETRLSLELGPPALVTADASEIVSALVNLIVNAIEALAPTGGTITVRSGLDDGKGWIEVADDGPGMPREVRERAFEPFFTTKGDQGTGLGLAMVYVCVQRHGGAIELDTAPGEGARFRLSFPQVSSRPSSAGTGS